ncbi:MAG: hypothetical protein KatS3mg076_2278 [Candidatus Binatia bacterium]|nr:MAG: hypothetical protein KatS3mg076_2278 [Candidatus Binatia bacterium]
MENRRPPRVEGQRFPDATPTDETSELEHLSPELRREIHEAAERISRGSLAAARAFYRASAGARIALGESFREWVETGLGFLEREPPAREVATAFFSVDVPSLGESGFYRVRRWAGAVSEILRVSRKLASTFARETASVVPSLAPEALEAWARAGLGLLRDQGWEGEFCAQAFFTHSREALEVLHPRTYASWARLGPLLRGIAREGEVYRSLPRTLSSWHGREHELFLDTVGRLASRDPRAAFAFLREAPSHLASLTRASRTSVLAAFRACAPACGSELPEVLPLVAPIVRCLPPGARRREVLRLVEFVAARVPGAGLPFFRRLPLLVEQADEKRLASWVERGLEIAAQNPRAGVAYFGLESRTSVRVLEGLSTGVGLEELEGVLRRLVRMLSGQDVSFATVPVTRLCLPLESSGTVFLPERVSLFATREDNERLYRVLAGFAAGRREFGTYECPELFECFGSSPYAAFLEEAFLFTETFRVAHRIRASYPGLAADLDWVAREWLGACPGVGPPLGRRFFDALWAASTAGDPASLPPWLRLFALFVRPEIGPLSFPEARVRDSFAAAERIVARLGFLLDGEPTPSEPASPDDLGFEKSIAEGRLDVFSEDGSKPVSTPESSASELENPAERAIELGEEGAEGGGSALSDEELRRLLEGLEGRRLGQSRSAESHRSGLFVTELVGKLPLSGVERLREEIGELHPVLLRPGRSGESGGDVYFYDEWDYQIGDYRRGWCRLREILLDGDSGECFERILTEYSELVPEIRRQFQKIRPMRYRRVRGMEDGEEVDFDALVRARADWRARVTPSTKLYVTRRREERDVATVFLVDMSASTDEVVGGVGEKSSRKRIIDVTKAALVLMAQAIEEIGDAYAIYGFSGHGRGNVEFYVAKSFVERLSSAVRSRIGGMEPKRSTRMGAALRHAGTKLRAVAAARRHLILLSDGFPQDFDYGQDRRSNVYGIRDTAAALRELEAWGVVPYCITVDRAGHDYLREMCEPSRYMVIEDTHALPRELPKIYRKVTRDGRTGV